MKISVNQDVLFHDFGDEGVLLNQASEVFLRLNETALRMWVLLNEELTPAEIIERMGDEFDASRVELESDLRRFLGDLEERNLATIDDAS